MTKRYFDTYVLVARRRFEPLSQVDFADQFLLLHFVTSNNVA